MNKTALRSFAMNARKELIRKVEAQARRIGITPYDNEGKAAPGSPNLTADENKQRDTIVRRIRESGYDRVMEDAACTWFNRFTALRFMEVNGYVPARAEVLSSVAPGRPEADLFEEALSVDWGIDKELVNELIRSRDAERLFACMMVRQCGSLSRYLPFLFEAAGDADELLFPTGLLTDGSFLRQLTDPECIPESDWKRVELVGWLYQYYMTEEKDRAIKAKNKYRPEQIPAATQLFTPEWIVRYMVQNSLGRYWMEAHPEDRNLLDGWEFYLENLRPEKDLAQKLAPYVDKELKVEHIRCFDPAMGSGHILVYLFDVLYEIYSRCGYKRQEIPRLILTHNLYGLEIDDRAYRLACFSVMMKALQYDGSFFQTIEREGLSLRLASIQETNRLGDRDIAYLAGEGAGAGFQAAKRFVDRFKNAKTFGSLIEAGEYDYRFLEKRLRWMKDNPAEDARDEQSRQAWLELMPKLLQQADLLNASYPIVITNPPYMGSAYMNEELSAFVKKHYAKTKSDLFSAFLEMCFRRATPDGHLGFMTPFVWMFIAAYEPLRELIIRDKDISSLIQLEYSAFEDATVPICTFTLRNSKIDTSGEYVKLSDFIGAKMQPVKAKEAVIDPSVGYRYSAMSEMFGKVPGSSIAYWLDTAAIRPFDGPRIAELITTREGMTTADNDRFLREWYEVDFSRIGFGIGNSKEAELSGKRWFPYLKGGPFRKWYGNMMKVVNWERDGAEIKSNIDRTTGRIRSHNYNGNFGFREGITFPTVSSGKFGARYAPAGFMFDAKGAMGFFRDDSDLYMILALLNTAVSQYYLRALAPTLDFKLNKIMSIPALLPDCRAEIVSLCEQCMDIAKRDWDGYEKSWAFSTHPLLSTRSGSGRIEDAFAEWSDFKHKEWTRLKETEERLNAIFIRRYGLEHAVFAVAADEDITITKAHREKDIKSFLSYAVGCMFGRYSLDEAGLVCAGGLFEPDRYRTFSAVRDNIIPLIPGNSLGRDIGSKFVEFVEAAFGTETLADNLEYIAQSIGKKDGESAREAIESYFLTGFFKDHVSAYRRKPIYWLFSSGKQKAFACLIYMHRYDETTLTRIRTDYVHRQRVRLEAEKAALHEINAAAGTAEEISKAKKAWKALDAKTSELEAYDELLRRMADMPPELDPDNGVAGNYDKLSGLLAKLE
ncbi:BREX-1 system adenine-specific DNA-methyltransferase PglX [Paenibacillus mesophilus]|uniref:BREX-1 system adenine-specific DNA-methyltransferase PglX n=1 Tax=Paenibacillus mesophilus TaxID=2582849 RepID=UPI00110F3C9E|nr:BREX-1 system adenine-specific DNA-methyltransferase PglX [Paenibacillus mesophilus]TMV45816.1 BREX-1 system adenine-specific DNA-methyltransferase PglX [Paenibacillus mesophilus]